MSRSETKRAIWSGHITFGLISIPVGLYSAVEASERVSFRLLHRKDMSPIKYKKYCTKEDKEVPNDEIVKGYEVSKGKFAIVEEEELDEVQQSVGEGDRTIEILQFVDYSSINPLFIEKPYYLGPMKGGERAYMVLREALDESKRVGVARFYMRTRPLLATLAPAKKALSLAVMRSYEELRDPDEIHVPDQPRRPAEIKMAQMLIDQMAEEWDPTQHPNQYRRALEKLLASKRKFAVEEPRAAAAGAKEDNVVDLMEALRKSVSSVKGKGRRAAKRGAA
jgi:DNA end-binding protein Ku